MPQQNYLMNSPGAYAAVMIKEASPPTNMTLLVSGFVRHCIDPGNLFVKVSRNF